MAGPGSDEMAKMKSMVAVLKKLVADFRRADLRADQMHAMLVYTGTVEEQEAEADLRSLRHP